MKDPEKGCADTAARSRKSYIKDPEKSRADTAALSRKIYEKDLEKSGKNETGLAVSYKSKKTAAVVGEGTVGAGWATAPETMY